MAEGVRVAIGKYRLIAELGQGGMARVLLTMVTGPADVHKLLVVKELREEYAQDPEFLTMFLDEARLAARLNHPNVVHTYEVFAEGGRYFIAMDYLEGQPLHRLLHRVGRKAMPLEVHLRILADALAGLHYAHTLGDFDGTPLNVVHRDVSPQNVFVTYDGQVKLVDFGIAKAAGAAALTREGMVKGKIAYIAPEQARAEPVDLRADIFSVGVMLWEALAGQRLSRAQTELVALNQRITGADPRIRDVAPERPEALLAICERALAAEKEDRFASAADFQAALEEYLDSTGRRVSAKDVALLMTESFAEDRRAIRSMVEQLVKRLREAPSGESFDVPRIDIRPADFISSDGTPTSGAGPSANRDAEGGTLATVASSREQSKPGRRAGTHRADTVGDGSGGEEDDGVPSDVQSTQSKLSAAASIQPSPLGDARPTRRWTVVALAGVLAAAAVGYLLYRGEPSSVGQPSDSAAPGTDLGAPPPSSVASREPAADAGQRTIRIRVAVDPANAKITVDGVALATNPFEASVPSDAAVHRIRATAKGYEPQERQVSYDRDQQIQITLEPTTAAAGPGPRAARPSLTGTTASPTSASPEPVPGTATPAQQAKTARPIDETDPYKR